jgi:hypothetical protein
LSGQELEALFDLGYHLKHVDTIFGRVFADLYRRWGLVGPAFRWPKGTRPLQEAALDSCPAGAVCGTARA